MEADLRITATGIWFRYRHDWVLSDISLVARPGELCGIIGRNGSGKTTLLKVLCCLLVPQKGDVRYGGQSASTLGVVERALWTGYLPQDHGIPFPYRVEEVVAAGCAGRSSHFFRETPEDRALIAHAVSLFGLNELMERTFDALSAGERQRVCLARLLAQNPRFLLLDEPTVFLDPGQKAVLLKILRALGEAGYGVMIASHDRDLWPILDRVYVLSDGRLDEVPVSWLNDPKVVSRVFPEPPEIAFVSGIRGSE